MVTIIAGTNGMQSKIMRFIVINIAFLPEINKSRKSAYHPNIKGIPHFFVTCYLLPIICHKPLHTVTYFFLEGIGVAVIGKFRGGGSPVHYDNPVGVFKYFIKVG